MTVPLELQTALERHLAWWGLRDVGSEGRYDEWQRQTLPPQHRALLTQLLEAKRHSQSVADDIAFYDASVDPAVLPVLYSQRYHYYIAVGSAMGDRLGPAQHILDLGCGPGILTTFYATRYPDRQFLGLDRSPSCIETARQRAASLNLTNLQYACADLTTWTPDAQVDLILSAQALFQAEQDPGVPSRSWQTFERPHDQERQRAFERRTGLGERLDRLRGLLSSTGRVLLFEKTGHLARRVPFQRALAARGFCVLEPPVPLPNTQGEEVAGADLLYVLGRNAEDTRPGSPASWPESPQIVLRDEVFLCQGTAATLNWTRLPDKQVTATHRPKGAGGRDRSVELGCAAAGLTYLYMMVGSSHPVLLLASMRAHPLLTSLVHQVSTTGADPWVALTEALGMAVTRRAEEDPDQAPLYENHTAAAQAVWESLRGRAVEKQADALQADGRQLHIELGTSQGLIFLYCANTFDQRQLVVMDPSRRALLEAYYAEQVEANRSVLDASP